MKLKDGFLIENIDGRSIGVTCGDAAEKFSGMVTSTPVAEYALTLLAEKEMSEDELIDAIEARYDAPSERIAADMKAWLDTLRSHGLIEE